MGYIFIILIILTIALITVGILNKFAKNKTGHQIMLLGVEITVVGIALILISNSWRLFILDFLGQVLVVVGFTVNIFGFIND